MTLLNRLRTSRTDKFVVGLVRFFAYVAALETGGYDTDYLPRVVEGIQPMCAREFSCLLFPY